MDSTASISIERMQKLISPHADTNRHCQHRFALDLRCRAPSACSVDHESRDGHVAKPIRSQFIDGLLALVFSTLTFP